jgi:protein arginine kinase
MEELEDYLSGRLKEIIKDGVYFKMSDLTEIERGVLMERNLISRELCDATVPSGVVFSLDESESVMINEEDHLRLQVIEPGLRLREAYNRINELDEKIGEVVEYAYSDRFGFLTACPTNAGTGLRASVMLHLPALIMTRQMPKVFETVYRLGLAVRGFHGEGTSASGDFYQVSNQKAMGRSEEALIDDILSVVPQIARYERSIREALVEQTRKRLEDRVWRAYGLLSSCRLVSTEEALDMLSLIRLGLSLRILNKIDANIVSQLFVLVQPAHLTKRSGKEELSEELRDAERADFIRQYFAVN